MHSVTVISKERNYSVCVSSIPRLIKCDMVFWINIMCTKFICFDCRGKYGAWTVTDMEGAMDCLKNGDAGLNEVARLYNVPKATLKRHVDNKNKYANGNKKYSGRPTSLPAELESILVQHCLELESMMIGLTRHDLMDLAYQLAEINQLDHSFNREKKSASKHWFYDFMKRHHELSLRQAEATSTARARGFNKRSVGEYFDKLEALIDKHSFDAAHVDESGITTVQKPGKVIGRRGKKQVGSFTSGERGFTTTVVCCFSASGT